MPSSQSHGNQHRRIFRGKGGATDGRLPPKKNHRVKVKYHPENNANEAQGVNADAHENESSFDESDNDNNDEQVDNDIQDDGVIKEIHHLQKRIFNIQTSLQTSRGMSNPQIWYSNCLSPVKNAVKEWRSICKYHFGENNDTSCTPYRDVINETSVQVFNLIQMAMQSGPLVGSNPGYFKRCGSEVASIALGFLNEIVDLTGVMEANEAEPLDTTNTVGEVRNTACDRIENENAAASVDEEFNHDVIGGIEESIFNKDLDIASSSSSSSNDSSQLSKNDDASNSSTCSNTPNPSQLQTTQAFQSTFLFSEKQSQRLYQWIQNANKAVLVDKGPSKSSKKLQSQKSKKQQMKELKMERKLKKKRGGGGK
jgi:hypothetical protein